MEVFTPAELASAAASFALLDTRSVEAFAAGHLKGSGHLPVVELEPRRSELPPRDTAVLVIAEDGARAVANAEQLRALGYARVAWLDGSLDAVTDGLADRAPAARLWRPSPFLEEVLPLLPPPGEDVRVLDLAAGAGREAVFAALHGYRVEAWDEDRDVLERARELGERHGVRIETQVRDLERRQPDVPVAAFQVVMTFRFLHRPLLPHIAAAVAPGGCVVYETFLKGQERFGRPKHPRFLLDPDELPRHFAGFVIERYEERTPPEGPWLARLMARKPA
jgi:rhodanese-related sulfurtransferase